MFGGSLAKLLCFWCYQFQKLRDSRRIALFLMLSTSDAQICKRKKRPEEKNRKSERIQSWCHTKLFLDRWHLDENSWDESYWIMHIIQANCPEKICSIPIPDLDGLHPCWLIKHPRPPQQGDPWLNIEVGAANPWQGRFSSSYFHGKPWETQYLWG